MMQARYKGKGAKFYAGKISAIHPDRDGKGCTFNIAYNDGDKEDGALPANVRRTGPAAVDHKAQNAAQSVAALLGSPRRAGVSDIDPMRPFSVPSPVAVDADGKPVAVGDAVEVRVSLGQTSRLVLYTLYSWFLCYLRLQSHVL
jgi:hypothetical protein